MAECNDCLELEQDSCQGEKKATECVYSIQAIPILGIQANEALNISLEKIAIIIQTQNQLIEDLQNQIENNV